MSKYHSILGLQPNASEKEIKQAYRKLALTHHPDQGGSQEKFVEINEAYEVLTGKRQPQSSPGQGDPFQNIWDFMNNINQQPRRTNKPRPPTNDRDVHFTLRLSADEVKAGGTLSLAYEKSTDCNACNGEGGSDKIACGRCQGQGQIVHMINHGGIRMQTTTLCSHCNGVGETFSSKCNDCDGRGWTAKEHKLCVEIKVKEEK